MVAPHPGAAPDPKRAGGVSGTATARRLCAVLLGLGLALAGPATAQESLRPLPGEPGGPTRLGAPATSSPAAAPADGELTVESIFGSYRYLSDRFSGTWRADGERWVTVERDAKGRPTLVQVDAASGERDTLATTEELTPEGRQEPVGIYDFGFSPRERRLLLFTDAREVWRDRTRGTYWVFDLEERTLAPVSEEPGAQMFARFSPDGRRVAFVRENDLFVVDLETGRERALTTSGGDDVINGTTDWVYEEELGLRDAFRWGPEGRRIAYLQLDQSPVDSFPYRVNQDSLYPEISWVRYPKAGTENSRVRAGVVGLDDGETRWLDLPFTNDHYIARLDWPGASDEVALQLLNRRQDRLELILGDASSGETRTVLAEADSAWVDVGGRLHWTGDAERFVWAGEPGDMRHLYLYRRDGTRVRQLTSGDREVTSVHGVDDERGRVYFTAASPDPLSRSVYWVGLDGSGPHRVAGGDGVHSADFAPGFRYFVDRHSTAGVPPTSTLRRGDGSEVRTLVDNAALRARVDSLGLVPPEFIRVEAADGTPLNGYLIRPPDFDPEREYALLMYVYGGPGSQTVMDRWGGRRYLWHQMLARQGILVASVDNRGTGARGRDFEKQTYLKLGQMESADQLAARGQLADRPYVDGSRTAIWGWSYGGYTTLMSTLTGGEGADGGFAAGVSVAPVTSWEFYDTIYTERYMWTPDGNPDGYRKGAPINFADRLDADLLLVHGTGDDNVHFQNTVRMVDALEQANEQFSLRIYPNAQHGIAGPTLQVNLFRMITDHLEDSLTD